MLRFSAAFLVLVSTAYPIELYTTTAEIVQDAPHVASVMVEEGSLQGSVLVYRLLVTEDFKGSLPERIEVRIPVLAEMGTSRTPEASGSQWLLMLGNGANNLYPLRSINWGKIPILINEEGQMALGRNLTGFGGHPFRGKSFTLSEFREVTRSYRKGSK